VFVGISSLCPAATFSASKAGCLVRPVLAWCAAGSGRAGGRAPLQAPAASSRAALTSMVAGTGVRPVGGTVYLPSPLMHTVWTPNWLQRLLLEQIWSPVIVLYLGRSRNPGPANLLSTGACIPHPPAPPTSPGRKPTATLPWSSSQKACRNCRPVVQWVPTSSDAENPQGR
jgi:hypothetical protein